ncbi:sugar 3,4-ketoisomerase [Rufibacter hautae]|uniref:WxcM-like domain-containing protein n=1 Tax=Rufibacter hautae TaxID=2595005 RepID=A0A5B6TIW4_9BACT|nr:FdtA/QdtA family cupin domain-containing protein [Rufibacter hautae]KAA3439387.1 WxcM-like domain-containing protein [Rufibacter hautae]
MKVPYLFDFDSIGNESSGFLVTTQKEQWLPFELKRVFWVHGTPPNITRGQHAHYQTEMVLVILQASATIEVENLAGQVEVFNLDNPKIGLFVPIMHWSRIYLDQGAVLLCLASTDYDEADYIRDYNEFRAFN